MIRRAGFTLLELLVGTVIAGLFATAILRILVAENRSLATLAETRNARATARSGVNLLLSELRMVETEGGVEAAATDGKSLTVRDPFGFGLICQSDPTGMVVSLLPVDPDLFALPGFSGFAWKESTASPFTYLSAASGATLTDPGPVSACEGEPEEPDRVLTLTGGRVVSLGGPLSSVPPAGMLAMLYRRVRFEFKASGVFPGRIGLWATLLDAGPLTEEVAAPFDNTARFRYFVLNDATARDTPPASLADLRGLEIRLNAESGHAVAAGLGGYRRAGTTVSVMFTNRPD